MGGKNALSSSGWVRVLPSRTAFFTLRIILATITVPADFSAISRAYNMGTPDSKRVAIVEENLSVSARRRYSLITGNLNIKLSRNVLPLVVRRNFANLMFKFPVIKEY